MNLNRSELFQAPYMQRMYQHARSFCSLFLILLFKWIYILTIVCVGFIYIFRAKDRILMPQFVAEDGLSYFQNAYNLPFLQSVILPYRGGFYFIGRLLSELSLNIQFEYAPITFVLFSLIIQVICSCLFLSERFAWIIPNIWYRALFCLIIAAIPASNEVHLRLYNVHWYLAILAFLLVLIEAPRRWYEKSLYVLLWVVIGFSAPQVIVFAPCMVVRAIVDRRIRWPSLAVVFVLFWVAIATSRANSEGVTSATDFRPIALCIAIINAIAFRVLAVANIGLNRLFEHFYQKNSLLFVYLFFIPYIAFLIHGASIFWQRQRRDYLLIWIFLLYCTTAPLALLFLGRAEFLLAGQQLSRLWGDDRYYILPICAFYFGLLWWLSLNPFGSKTLAKARWILVLPIVFAITSDFWIPNVFISDFQWKSQVRRIKEAEALAPGSILDVPINPTSEWTMKLHIPPLEMPSFDDLHIVDQPARGYFDFAARNTTLAGLDPHPSQEVSLNEAVRASGWVFADGTQNHPSEVIIVDNTEKRILARTPVILERRDLIAVDPGLLISGWQVVFPIDQLTIGEHVLHAYSFDAQKFIVHPIPGEIQITILPAH